VDYAREKRELGGMFEGAGDERVVFKPHEPLLRISNENLRRLISRLIPFLHSCSA
jgi:hypothetical protein